MPRPRIADHYRYMTTTDVCRKLGITEYQLRARLAQSVFPVPTMVNQQGVRYFDEEWLRAAWDIVERRKKREPT